MENTNPQSSFSGWRDTRGHKLLRFKGYTSEPEPSIQSWLNIQEEQKRAERDFYFPDFMSEHSLHSIIFHTFIVSLYFDVKGSLVPTL